MVGEWAGGVTFCAEHRSWFCPCVRTELYPELEEARAAWDAAEVAYREKEMVRRDC